VVQQQSQTISVGRATGEDAPQILACLRAAFEEYRRLYTPAAFLDTVLTPETILVRLAKFFVFVAVSDSSEVVGTIACNIVNAEEGHIRGMAVLPGLRCTGIAAIIELCGDRTAPPGNHSHHPRHHRTTPASDALLREIWLSSFGKSHELLWHALNRVPQIPVSKNTTGS
jgi:hypothetical protein